MNPGLTAGVLFFVEWNGFRWGGTAKDLQNFI